MNVSTLLLSSICFQINSVFSPGSVSTCDCVKMCMCSGLVLQPADVVSVNLAFPCSRRCEPLGKCYSDWLTNYRNLSEKSFTWGCSSKICVFFQLKKQTINWFQSKSILKKKISCSEPWYVILLLVEWSLALQGDGAIFLFRKTLNKYNKFSLLAICFVFSLKTMYCVCLTRRFLKEERVFEFPHEAG